MMTLERNARLAKADVSAAISHINRDVFWTSAKSKSVLTSIASLLHQLTGIVFIAVVLFLTGLFLSKAYGAEVYGEFRIGHVSYTKDEQTDSQYPPRRMLCGGKERTDCYVYPLYFD